MNRINRTKDVPVEISSTSQKTNSSHHSSPHDARYTERQHFYDSRSSSEHQSLPNKQDQEQILSRSSVKQFHHPENLTYSLQKRSSIYSTDSSSSSDHYPYPFQRNRSVRSNKKNENRSQRSHLKDRARSTIILIEESTAQEAPAPLFDPFILMDSKSEPRTYHLIIRQSPMHGQMCTLGSKERRILDPLPIVQLDIRDRFGNRDIVGQGSPLLIMQVNLITEQIDFGNSGKSSVRNRSRSPSNSLIEARRNTSPTSSTLRNSGSGFQRGGLPGFASMHESSRGPYIDQMADSRFEHDSQLLSDNGDTHFPAIRLLEGKLTASPHIVKDVEDFLGTQSNIRDDSNDQKRQKGEKELLSHDSGTLKNKIRDSSSTENEIDQKACFFIFTDLSIRLRGTFRLEFSLIKLGMPSFSKNPTGEIVAKTISDPFPIHHVRDFAGLTKSTPLAKSLALQGVHIPIRNDSRWRSGVQLKREKGE